MYYYSFQKNTYLDMMKQALWICKDDLGADALSLWTIGDHDPAYLEKELKFKPNVEEPFNWYMVNYSLGENVVNPSDVGLIMV